MSLGNLPRYYNGFPNCRQEDVRLSDPDSTVKVHADKPHLVSLGSGRLSTAVTIIPLHNGRTDIGTVDAEVLPDLIIQGTGVEDDHCYIDNIHGVVTFTPLAKLCFIDQHLVCEPTRLTQEAGCSPLHIACFMGKIDVVCCLLDHNANINITNEDGTTPLFFACEVGHEDIVCLLLDKGADTQICRLDSKSPLQIATDNEHTSIVMIVTKHLKKKEKHSF
ncbi:unnamed protein product [Mytilus edulis]|uniref:Uncharacterized protein n=1 Tax=Mytilus edulis TaxID=6550 RepID=A0A8S3T3L0_MYTED|nr:unnamed protein product [Mytilus edulis]